MSLASALRRAAAPATLAIATAFTAANANAADVELSHIDISKPFTGCVADSSQGTAISKLNILMASQKQMMIFAGNENVPGKDAQGKPTFTEVKQGEAYTTNENGSLGYIIGSNKPKEVIGSQYCLEPITAISVYNAYTQKSVPPRVNKGELGQALTNSFKNGEYVVMTAEAPTGALKTITFDPSTKSGGYTISNKDGSKAGLVSPMTEFDYTAKAKVAFKIVEPPMIAAAISSQGTLATVAFDRKN